MTFIKEKFIPCNGKFINQVKRICICRCDVCDNEFEVSHCVKATIAKEYHFCSKNCRSIAKQNGGIINEKTKATCLARYGVENPYQSEEIKEKIKIKCLEHFGVEYHTQSENFKEKTKIKCLERFGVEYPTQCEEIQEKSKATNLERYGHENPGCGVIAKEKSKQTCFEHYGCENPAQSQEIQDKIKATCLEKYGFEHPLQSTTVQDKIKATCLKKYGFEHPMQNTEIFSKIQRSRRKAVILLHWKTGKELICIGSYEVAFVNWCNANQTDFEWQISFPTPILTPKGNSSIYVIDAHILDGKFVDTWIEIKGYLKKNSSSEKKWEWFHSTHPNNSQFWNRPILKELGIL